MATKTTKKPAKYKATWNQRNAEGIVKQITVIVEKKDGKFYQDGLLADIPEWATITKV